MPKHKRGIIPNQYSLVQPTNISSEQSTPAESKETLNILNGVLNCAWNKTSAIPKLLEIANTSEVKFNIDSDNPLVVAFANGWDDKDRPAQIVKRLATAPSNIDLSAKANCKVQIVARVINDELVITTHDIFDPNVGYGVNICPDFVSGYVDEEPFTKEAGYVSSKEGWTVYSLNAASSNSSTARPRHAFQSTSAGYSFNWGTGTIAVTFPFPLTILKWTSSLQSSSVSGEGYYLKYWDSDLNIWVKGTETYPWKNTNANIVSLIPPTPIVTTKLQLYANGGYITFRGGNTERVALYEAPTAKYFRSLNKVKDRTDTEVYWVNLGYATVDANGAITALTHYTDLRNNYPGGMRVEA